MSLYSEFSSLLPYLQSVRKIKDYLSFDIHFPISWKLPKKFINEEMVMEQESGTDGQRLFSFVSEINEGGVEVVSENLRGIIKYNLEREEKERLFDMKVKELKTIFEKQTLRALKDLHFDITPKKIELEDVYEEHTITGVREVREGEEQV
jgi:hypothetical protein